MANMCKMWLGHSTQLKMSSQHHFLHYGVIVAPNFSHPDHEWYIFPKYMFLLTTGIKQIQKDLYPLNEAWDNCICLSNFYVLNNFGSCNPIYGQILSHCNKKHYLLFMVFRWANLDHL